MKTSGTVFYISLVLCAMYFSGCGIAAQPQQDAHPTAPSAAALQQDQVLPSQSGEPAEQQWRSYKGAYFRVSYPAEFSPSGSIKTSRVSPHGGEFDSVFFTSPDNQVRFYVYTSWGLHSWDPIPNDIALKQGESLLSEKWDEGHESSAHWQTILGADGMTRSVLVQRWGLSQDPSTADGVVFGIIYSDDAARQSYAEQYQRFKDSFEALAHH